MQTDLDKSQPMQEKKMNKSGDRLQNKPISSTMEHPD